MTRKKRRKMLRWIKSERWSENGKPKRPGMVVPSNCLPVSNPRVFGYELIPVPFMLRNIWTAGLVLFALIMGSTFFITKVWQVSPVTRVRIVLGADLRLLWQLPLLEFVGLLHVGCECDISTSEYKLTLQTIRHHHGGTTSTQFQLTISFSKKWTIRQTPATAKLIGRDLVPQDP